MAKRIFLMVMAFVFFLSFGNGAMAKEVIKIGGLHDLTGGLNIYGIQQSQAFKLAVKQLNETGGINGAKIELVEYDTQSDLAKYTQYANTHILRDKVKALFGGLTSASREAVRPIAHKNRIPYFYSALYEGGVCDRYNFLTGVTPSQQLSVLMKWAIKRFGNKFYTVAPDYNFGTISAHWVKYYAKQYGGEVVGEDFLPLSQSDFGATIQKIQMSKANVVVAIPVGSNQTSFFEQFAAAGLKDKIGVVSTNYGSGNQQVVVSPQAGKGIIASQNYFMVIDTPMNKKFIELWKKEYGEIKEPIISEANDTWNAVMLWAEAAKKAGSADPEKVIDAIQTGIELDSPEGKIKMLPGSHHFVHNVFIVAGDDKHNFEVIEEHKNVLPEYEEQVCDLTKNPKTSKQFVPEF